MEDARRDVQTLRLEALEARQQAERLLEQLTGELKELSGGQDLYKQVTGQNSLERAIDETRRMIACYDRVLEQIDKPEGDLVVRRLNWQSHGVAV